jgi:radical SAM superfamily enzyme YgiQ (UPF0313 family)
MSLLAVGAVLENHYEYTIVDGNLEDEPLARLENLLEANPTPILALTVMPGPQLTQAVPLCHELKHRMPHLTIVWGGYFPTQHWDVCLGSAYVDYVVRGHGEYAFLQLLDLLTGRTIPLHEPHSATSHLSSIPGLAYRDQADNPVTNPLAPIPPPKTLPPWNFDRVPVGSYVRSTFLGTRTLGYHSSYGCPFFCNFCAVVNMVNGRWLPQSAASTAAIAHLYRQRWNINAIEFYDNNFFTQEARVAEFSQRIMDLEMAWWGEGRIDTLMGYSSRTWELMRDAGLKMIFLGAESGSMETLKRMHKGGKMSPDKTVEMVRRMKAYDIVPELSFVMGNPPDPQEDAWQTMEFIRQIKQLNPAAEIIMYLYTPVPLAGDLYEEAKATGFAFPDTLDQWVSPEWLDFSQRRSITMPWIKQPLREQLHDFERVLNAYYPTATDHRLGSAQRLLLR